MLIAGLVPEGVSEAEMVQKTSELISKEVLPVVKVQIVSVTRMGSFQSRSRVIADSKSSSQQKHRRRRF